MTTPRLLAIAFILIASSVAWFALGISVTARSGEFNEKLAAEVSQLWGGPHRQVAPTILIERDKQVTESSEQNGQSGQAVRTQVTRTVVDPQPLSISSSRINANLSLKHRQKGLLWYDTFTVQFQGRYAVTNPDSVPRQVVARLAFPSKDALYDGFTVRFNGTNAAPLSDLANGVEVRSLLAPGAVATLEVAYESRGLDSWQYALSESGVSQAQDLQVQVTTDFDDVDFPAGTASPTSLTRSGNGQRLEWQFASLVTGQGIGIDLPEKINPGPLAARITFFAPVSLLFFVSVLVILGVLRGENLHPMNYAFIAAAFFSFHLLLAYLVDHVQIHVAFAAAALTSIALVASYLRIVAGVRFAVVQAGLAQLIFLVLFSYAFFFEGFTGLTVTVGAIITLFIMMQVTARVDWSKALTIELPGFGRRAGP